MTVCRSRSDAAPLAETYTESMSSQEGRPGGPGPRGGDDVPEPEGAPRDPGPPIASERKPQPESAPVAADPDRVSSTKDPDPMGSPVPRAADAPSPEVRPEPMGAPEPKA